MKVSTSLFNKQQVESFSKLNEEIQSLQNRISSGKNIVQASDDPIGAVELSGLQQVKERFNQYSRNADNAINRLTIADNALQSITNLMARAKELAIQAANDTFGAQDREALALELIEMKEEMLSTANSTDSSGAYIFGGYHTGTQPFEKNSKGVIEYKGDRGTNSVAVSETRNVGTTLDGGSVFMAVKSNNSVAPMFNVLEDIINSIRTSAGSVVEAKAIGKATLKIDNGNPGNFSFILSDNEDTANISVDLPSNDLSGVVSAINSSGLTITASLSGNTITLEDSKNGPITIKDLQVEGIEKSEKEPKSFLTFDAIDGSGNSLGVPQVLYDKNQTIQNRLDDIIGVQDHIANQKAIIGARTNSLDRQKELIAQRTIAIEKDMSSISDADLAALVTELQGQITGLQASQQAFVKISNLSLFQFLG
ncbi:flagellar hook-associated protein FlgL [Alphaproteobacteria bacterium]|nr:flagellar hook-associated protein FlgL [Alphaproteobacteria bacterium]